MGFNIIKFIFFIYIITTYCLSTIEKFKRSVESYNDHYNLFDENILQNRENKKRSINNINDEIYRKKRMISGDFTEKWFFPIPYFVGPDISHFLVEKALAMIQRETCIRFKKYKVMKPKMSGIHYARGNNCSSPIGRVKGRVWQTIFLTPYCEKLGRIQHETLHSLGIFHAHCRVDRNRFLTIDNNNVRRGFKGEFRVVHRFDSSTLGVPFDFGSVMMYPPHSFSKNKRDTIVSLDPRYKNTYGVADRISYADAKMLNKFYCPRVCRKQIDCSNGGYQNPNNCKKCKCVLGYIGPRCNLYVQPSRLCGRSKLQAQNEIKQFSVRGKKDYVYHVFAPSKSKIIAMKILYSEFIPNDRRPCHIVNSLEIKYWDNKVSTGARFCNIQSNILIFSETDHVIIYFRSRTPRNNFRILYKSINRNANQKRVNRDFSAFKELTE